MKDVPVKSVKKALDLLSLIIFKGNGKEGIELKELAKKIDAPVNTTHNLLKTMVACGFVSQNKRGKYVPGWKCERIKMEEKICKIRENGFIRAELEKISQEIGETIVFILLIEGRRVPVMHINPDGQVIKIDHSVIDRRSIYELVTGKVLVAFANATQLSEIFQHNGEWDDYEAEREVIVKQGYASKITDEGLYTVAVPLFEGKSDFIVGSLGCYAFASRCNREKRKNIIRILKDSANKIMTQIGGMF